MKGYFRKRGKSWSYTVDIGRDSVTNKRRQKTKGGFKTKKEAQAACTEVINQFNKGINVITKKQPLNEYLYEWLNLYAKLKVKETTFKNYKRAIDSRINPFLGSVKIDELTLAHGQKFIQYLVDEGLKPSYIEYVFTVLKSSLEKAVEWELIIKNPILKVELPRPRRRNYITWSLEEVDHFLKFAKNYNISYYTLFLVLIYTGMRRGEVLALRWSDIKLDNHEISIIQNLIYDEEGFRFSDLKTQSSKRVIKIDDFVVKELKAHKAKQNEMKLFMGNAYNHDLDLVFCREDGQPLYPRTVAQNFTNIIKKAKVPQIRIHDLRHTHATLLMELGENPKVVAERLGHSNIATTLRTYSHVTPKMQEEAVKNFGTALRKKNI